MQNILVMWTLSDKDTGTELRTQNAEVLLGD
jgi:hypothetical protein